MIKKLRASIIHGLAEFPDYSNILSSFINGNILSNIERSYSIMNSSPYLCCVRNTMILSMVERKSFGRTKETSHFAFFFYWSRNLLNWTVMIKLCNTTLWRRAYRLPHILVPFWAKASKGPTTATCAFTQGEISPSPPSPSSTPPYPQRWDSNPSLKARIPSLKPKSQPQGPNPCLEIQISTLRPKS